MRRFDGVWMGASNPLDKTIYEAFDPPWWRVDRWVTWLALRVFKRNVARGTVTLEGRSVRVIAVNR